LQGINFYFAGTQTAGVQEESAGAYCTQMLSNDAAFYQQEQTGTQVQRPCMQIDHACNMHGTWLGQAWAPITYRGSNDNVDCFWQSPAAPCAHPRQHNHMDKVITLLMQGY